MSSFSKLFSQSTFYNFKNFSFSKTPFQDFAQSFTKNLKYDKAHNLPLTFILSFMTYTQFSQKTYQAPVNPQQNPPSPFTWSQFPNQTSNIRNQHGEKSGFSLSNAIREEGMKQKRNFLFEEASTSFMLAYQMAHNQDGMSTLYKGELLYHYAYCLQKMDRIDEAIEYYRKSAETLFKAKCDLNAYDILERAILLDQHKLPGQKIQEMKSVIQHRLDTTGDDPLLSSLSLSRLAKLQIQADLQVDEALEALESSYEICYSYYQDRKSLLSNNMLYSALYDAMEAICFGFAATGNFDMVRKTANYAIMLAKHMSIPKYEDSIWFMSEVMEELGEYTKAIGYYRLSINISKESPGADVRIGYASQNIADLYEKINDLDHSIEFRNKAISSFNVGQKYENAMGQHIQLCQKYFEKGAKRQARQCIGDAHKYGVDKLGANNEFVNEAKRIQDMYTY